MKKFVMIDVYKLKSPWDRSVGYETIPGHSNFIRLYLL